MGPAGHPRGHGLQHRGHGAQVQGPPTSPARPGVIARTTTATQTAPALLPRGRAHMGHQHLAVLVELDTLDHGLLDTHQAPP